MRVFFASPATAHQTSLPDSHLWHVNLYEPLVELGHEVVVFDFDYSEFNQNLDPSVPEQQAFIEANRPRLSRELLRQFTAGSARGHFDLFFSYFYSAYADPAAIREIGATGVPTVNWYCNASYQFGLVEEIAPAYDWCLVPERFRLDDYRRAGANPIYCQEAANPNVYRPYDLPSEFDITFVGQRYGDRPTFVRALLDAGLDARAWGPNWTQPPPVAPAWRRAAGHVKRRALRRPSPRPAGVPTDRCGPPLSDLEYVQMYSRSQISLGFSKVAEGAPRTTSIKQVRLRDFEAPMSGAFYLVERCEELEDFFEPDREIVCFDDAAELVEKARYYLANEGARNRIRQAGMRRARAEHSWQARFKRVFAEIGLE
jgi:spore maturation protein CgeB